MSEPPIVFRGRTMQKLARAVDAACDGDLDGGLQEAAKEWAASSLDMFEGDLLKRALDISAAIASFTAMLPKGEPANDTDNA